MKIWKCCRTLFSLGPVERRDAYSVLSLYLSFLPCDADKVAGLDISADKEFWEEIKRGLVSSIIFSSFLDKSLLFRCQVTQVHRGRPLIFLILVLLIRLIRRAL